MAFSYFLRGLGLILVGAGLYRLGFMNGGMSPRTYRTTAAVGTGIGLSLATVSVIVTALGDYSRSVAFIGQIPNTLGTIPASLGYMSLIILWNGRPDNWLKRRLRAVGRMALTNSSARLSWVSPCSPCCLPTLPSAGRRVGFRADRLGLAAMVVVGLARPFPVRPRRVAMARRHLPPEAAIAPRMRPSTGSPHGATKENEP